MARCVAVLFFALLVSLTFARMELCAQDEATMRGGDNNKIGLFFARAHQLGVTHIRVIVYMHDLNVGPGCPSGLGNYERQVAQVIQNGFQPQIVFTGVAANWGVACGTGSVTGVRPDPRAFANFVATYAPIFYGQGARRFSMWNEANYPTFLCAGSVSSSSNVDRTKCHASLNANAELYARLYIAGYGAVRWLQRTGRMGGVQVLFGDFAGNGIQTANYIFRRYKIKADGYAWHPYQYCTNPATGKLASRSCKLKMAGLITAGQLKSKLKGWHRGGRFTTPRGGAVPMYMTEFGYHTSERGISLPSSTRAKFWKVALDVANRAGARGFNIYQFWPSPPGAWNTAILDGAGNATPSFYAIYGWAHRHHYPVGRL